MVNAKLRMSEAYTVAQGTGCSATKTTDDGFSHSERGDCTITIPAAQRKAVENLSHLVTNGDGLAKLGEKLAALD